MKTRRVFLAILVWLTSACIWVGCASTHSLDPNLDRAVGRRISEIQYPPLDRVRDTQGHGATVQRTYQLTGAGRCKWRFVIDVEKNTVLSWHYPDEESRQSCQSLATTRP